MKFASSKSRAGESKEIRKKFWRHMKFRNEKRYCWLHGLFSPSFYSFSHCFATHSFLLIFLFPFFYFYSLPFFIFIFFFRTLRKILVVYLLSYLFIGTFVRMSYCTFSLNFEEKRKKNMRFHRKNTACS